jgi:hypothetical protein
MEKFIEESNLNQLYTEMSLNMYKNADTVHKLLDIMLEYIVENKKIVVGGRAISAELAEFGINIYSKQNYTEYDIISDDYIADAYSIVNLLFKLGYQKLAIINAIHMTCIRIKHNDNFIMDITYVPTELIKKIPVKTHATHKFLYCNSDYQRLDIYLSLTNPFSYYMGVQHPYRFKKDLIRLEHLDTHLPLPQKQVKYKTQKITEQFNERILFGFASYSLFYKYTSELKLNAEDRKEFEKLQKLEYTKTDTSITTEIPVGAKFTCFQDISPIFLTNSRFLGLLPESIQEKERESAYYTCNCKQILYDTIDDIMVASPSNSMVYFLTFWIFHSNDLYLMFANDFMKMVQIGLKYKKNPSPYSIISKRYGKYNTPHVVSTEAYTLCNKLNKNFSDLKDMNPLHVIYSKNRPQNKSNISNPLIPLSVEEKGYDDKPLFLCDGKKTTFTISI